MEEMNSRRKRYEDHVPEEARQHFHAAREEMRKSVETLLPPGFLEHRRSARREMLLAWRSLLDDAIRRIDEKNS